MNKRRFLLGIICSFMLFLGVGTQELSAREATKPAVRLKLMGVNRTLDPWKLWPHIAFAINRNTWNKLPQDIQSLMKEEAERIIEGKTFEMIEVWNIVGGRQNFSERLEQLRAVGTLHGLIRFVMQTQEHILRAIQIIGDQVIPQVS
jgi:hypothetical protein